MFSQFHGYASCSWYCDAWNIEKLGSHFSFIYYNGSGDDKVIMLLGYHVDIISVSNRGTMCKAPEVFRAISVSDSKTAIQLHSVCSHIQLLQCRVCHSMLEPFRIFIKVSRFRMLQGDLNHLLWSQSRYLKSNVNFVCVGEYLSEYMEKKVDTTCFTTLTNLSPVHLPLWDHLGKVWMWGTVPGWKYDSKESQFHVRSCM